MQMLEISEKNSNLTAWIATISIKAYSCPVHVAFFRGSINILVYSISYFEVKNKLVLR